MERKITREQFLEESLKLFQEKGFKATTMRDIATRLNIEAPTIYNYIPSKQALLDMLVFEIANKFLEGMQFIEQSSYNPGEKLKALINLNVRLTSEYPYQVALLVSNWKHLAPDRMTAFLENRGAYERAFQSIVEAGIQEGLFRNMNVEIATFSILSSIRWLFNWYIQQKEVVNPIELEKQLTEFIFKGIQVGG